MSITIQLFSICFCYYQCFFCYSSYLFISIDASHFIFPAILFILCLIPIVFILASLVFRYSFQCLVPTFPYFVSYPACIIKIITFVLFVIALVFIVSISFVQRFASFLILILVIAIKTISSEYSDVLITSQLPCQGLNYFPILNLFFIMNCRFLLCFCILALTVSNLLEFSSEYQNFFFVVLANLNLSLPPAIRH